MYRLKQNGLLNNEVQSVFCGTYRSRLLRSKAWGKP
nr:MAG TPA: hypothetical protein [Caudoviricetes sp.]